MNAARRPPQRRDEVGLVVLNGRTGFHCLGRATDLIDVLEDGDLLVLNDAATFPASLALTTERKEPVEVRLIEQRSNRFLALAFGAGDWRTPTEQRPLPPLLPKGSWLRTEGQRIAQIVGVDARSPRMIDLRFAAADPWEPIYRLGRPVQYSYLEQDQQLWAMQTAFGSRPVASEMPSAGRPLSWSILRKLKQRGVALAWLTHAVGPSSTGDAQLDALLPLPERYEIPETTSEAIRWARMRGGRIIAAGTTVVRALESAARAGDGRVRPGSDRTDLVIEAATPLLVVDGILTGLHEPSASHYRLLSAFAKPRDLAAAWETAEEAGLHTHEFGDLALISGVRP